jgi:hypothetical protein
MFRNGKDPMSTGLRQGRQRNESQERGGSYQAELSHSQHVALPLPIRFVLGMNVLLMLSVLTDREASTVMRITAGTTAGTTAALGLAPMTALGFLHANRHLKMKRKTD